MSSLTIAHVEAPQRQQLGFTRRMESKLDLLSLQQGNPFTFSVVGMTLDRTFVVSVRSVFLLVIVGDAVYWFAVVGLSADVRHTDTTVPHRKSTIIGVRLRARNSVFVYEPLRGKYASVCYNVRWAIRFSRSQYARPAVPSRRQFPPYRTPHIGR